MNEILPLADINASYAYFDQVFYMSLIGKKHEPVEILSEYDPEIPL